MRVLHCDFSESESPELHKIAVILENGRKQQGKYKRKNLDHHLIVDAAYFSQQPSPPPPAHRFLEELGGVDAPLTRATPNSSKSKKKKKVFFLNICQTILYIHPSPGM